MAVERREASDRNGKLLTDWTCNLPPFLLSHSFILPHKHSSCLLSRALYVCINVRVGACVLVFRHEMRVQVAMADN